MVREPLVLLVDDDANTRTAYEELLTSRGFDVVAAGDAGEAVTLCRARTPDVVITDIALPDADGFKLAAELRREAGARHLPIVAMTGYWETDGADRAKRAGITALLAKPCQPEHLVAELNRVLRIASDAQDADDEP